VLPEDRVVLLTSAGLLLVHAPGFTQLDGAAEIGEQAGRRMGCVCGGGALLLGSCCVKRQGTRSSCSCCLAPCPHRSCSCERRAAWRGAVARCAASSSSPSALPWRSLEERRSGQLLWMHRPPRRRPHGGSPAAPPPPAVRWEDVLALELRWSREMRYPDRLVVHRKGKLDQPVGGGGSDAAHARACLPPAGRTACLSLNLPQAGLL
jgi:hypothetical protein